MELKPRPAGMPRQARVSAIKPRSALPAWLVAGAIALAGLTMGIPPGGAPQARADAADISDARPMRPAPPPPVRILSGRDAPGYRASSDPGMPAAEDSADVDAECEDLRRGRTSTASRTAPENIGVEIELRNRARHARPGARRNPRRTAPPSATIEIPHRPRPC